MLITLGLDSTQVNGEGNPALGRREEEKEKAEEEAEAAVAIPPPSWPPQAMLSAASSWCFSPAPVHLGTYYPVAHQSLIAADPKQTFWH